MHILAAILAVVLGAAFWIYRLNAARDAAETLADAANDVRRAARRFGFRRKTNMHPAECVGDARLVAMGIGAAVVQMQRTWDREASDTLVREAQRLFDVGVDEATEMTVFGRWLSDQSGTQGRDRAAAGQAAAGHRGARGAAGRGTPDRYAGARGRRCPGGGCRGRPRHPAPYPAVGLASG
jgi:hypothetical protein